MKPMSGGWASPEQPPERGPELVVGDPTVTDATTPASVPSARGRPVPRLAVFDRPLTVADVLDGSFEIIRARPRTVAIFAALFVLPGQMLHLLLDPEGYSGLGALIADPGRYFDDVSASGGGGPSGTETILLPMLGTLSVPFVAAGVSRLVEGWYGGHDRTARECLAFPKVRYVSLLGAWVLAHMAMVAGLVALGIPSLVFMSWWLVAAPAIVLEELRASAGLGRSRRLGKGSFWRVLWIGLLCAVVSGIVASTLPLLPLALVSLFDAGGERVVAAASTMAVSLLTEVFAAGVAVMAYFDLRVRREGIDLQTAIAREFAADAR
jgi:hypothetical protein